MNITNHAKKRFQERFGIKNIGQMIRYAEEAFRNGKEPNKFWMEGEHNLNSIGLDYFIYKQWKETIYVFQQKERMTLLTIYKLYD